ncbi:MAG: HAMP domain-containing histidine kinase [Acidobacteria bacterium]|nr:HAMP domain-containing histidine kinase [Acidobacteriota bacterium]
MWLKFGAGLGLNVALHDASGKLVLGRDIPAGQPRAVRNTFDTGLPWILHISNTDPAGDSGLWLRSRTPLMAAFALAAALFLAGGFLVVRSLLRELAVGRLQSDFVSSVSHEFRSPLASMRHLTGLLREGAVTNESRRAQYYDVLDRETERLHRLVESLLDFRRMQAGKASYNFIAIELREFATEAAADFRNELADPGRLEFEPGPDPLFVNADANALSTALHNLLDNAAKYSPPGLAIRLSVRSGNGEACLEVADSGLGIPAAEQRKIFNAFYRGEDAKARRVKGTGIGLAMAAEIAAAHGGRITLASEPGAGSRFTIVLPIRGQKQE